MKLCEIGTKIIKDFLSMNKDTKKNKYFIRGKKREKYILFLLVKESGLTIIKKYAIDEGITGDFLMNIDISMLCVLEKLTCDTVILSDISREQIQISANDGSFSAKLLRYYTGFDWDGDKRYRLVIEIDPVKLGILLLGTGYILPKREAPLLHVIPAIKVELSETNISASMYDGYSYVHTRIDSPSREGDQKFLIPSETILMLKKVVRGPQKNISIFYDNENGAFLKFVIGEDTELVSKLFDPENNPFPNIGPKLKVIPGFNFATVSTKVIQTEIEYLNKCLKNKKDNIIKLSFFENSLTLVYETDETKEAISRSIKIGADSTSIEASLLVNHTKFYTGVKFMKKSGIENFKLYFSKGAGYVVMKSDCHNISNIICIATLRNG